MKTYFNTTTLAAIGMMGCLIPIHSARSEPTVPEKGVGGPEAVDLGTTQPKSNGKTETAPRKDLTISEIVSGAVDFTTFATALRSTGLDERLKEDGSITLLAPDNDAFAALPEGVLQLLMKPESRDILTKILTYHIIPKKLASSEIIPGDYKTSQGENLTVVVGTAGKATIQGATFGSSDIVAKNGLIHVVKAVLIPPTINIEDYKPAAKPNPE